MFGTNPFSGLSAILQNALPKPVQEVRSSLGYGPKPAQGAPARPTGTPSVPQERKRAAIKQIESDGSGGYSAIGARHPTLGRPLGAYQVMEANVGPWTREVLGREVDAETFLRSPQIQDAVFDAKFGQYEAKYGPEGAAQAWLGGEKGVGKTGRADVHGTTIGDYGKRYMRNLSGGLYANLPDGPKGKEVYRPQPSGLTDLNLDVAAGTQTLPGGGGSSRTPGGGRVSVETASSQEAPPARTPIGRAAEEWKVNKSTRRLRGLGVAPTLGVLTAIGQFARLSRGEG